MTTLGGPQDANEPGLASRLRLAVVRLNRRLRAQRDVEAVATLTQLSAMASLHRHGPMRPRELAGAGDTRRRCLGSLPRWSKAASSIAARIRPTAGRPWWR